MKDNNKITYKPNLKPTRTYYSDGLYPQEDFILEEYEKPEKTKEDIQEKIDNTIELAEYIPDEIRDNFIDILDALSDTLIDLTSDYEGISGPEIIIKEVEYEDSEVEEEHEKDEETKDRDDGFDKDIEYEDSDSKEEDSISDNFEDDYDFILDDYDPDVIIDLEKKKEVEDRARKEHDLHLSQIIDSYINKIEKIISEYIIRNLSALDNPTLEGLKYLLRKYTSSTEEITNKNLKHLSDTIIKEQIKNAQNFKLMNKIFNKKALQKNLRHCKAAALQRDRYYKIELDEKGDYKGFVKNHNLEEQRILSDLSYDSSFKNLYRFLHSQAECLKDSLESTTKEITSKAVLVEEEGIELKTKTDRFVEEYNSALEKEREKRKEREAKLQQRNKERQRIMEENKKIRDQLRDEEYEKRKADLESRTPSTGGFATSDSNHEPAVGNKKVPNIDTSFKSYMSYKAITYKGSVQYKIRQSPKSYTDSAGLRRVMLGSQPDEKNDDYQVAMTSYYGKPGDRLKVTLDNGFTYTLTISDQKKSSETDPNNMYHLRDKSVTEFLVDTSKLHPNIRKMGSVSGAKYSWSSGNEFSGGIKAIEALGENQFV